MLYTQMEISESVANYVGWSSKFFAGILQKFSSEKIDKEYIVESFFDAENVLISHSIPLLVAMLKFGFEDDERL